MKKKMVFALSAIVLGVAGYVGYQQVSASSESDLFLANVEALSEGEGVSMLECSEAIRSVGCYKKWEFGEMWECEAIKEVRSYQVVVGSPIICKHDVVSECPSGTYER